MEKVMRLTFASAIEDIKELNSSFDVGVLKIAYTDENRNKSSISEESYKKSINTIFNCPVVCNYNIEDNSIGGHDVAVADLGNGMQIINKTSPIGVVPESAKPYFCMVEEDDGKEHKYLCTDVILWKRQPAYEKIKKDGITAQSMEINVKDGFYNEETGYYEINDFEFTAFCLLGDGIEPCFESASLEMFSFADVKSGFDTMMAELKESILVNSSFEVDNTNSENFKEGGVKDMEEKIALAKEYGYDPENLDFSMEDLTIDELREKFDAMKSEQNPDQVNPEDKPTEDTYALSRNVIEELERTVGSVMVEREWGETNRYWFVDYDPEIGEVYCTDRTDYTLRGFHYEMDGDAVAVDFSCGKRKKYTIVDFDEGSAQDQKLGIFQAFDEKCAQNSEISKKYDELSDEHNKAMEELGELRAYKLEIEKIEAAALDEKKDEVFNTFAAELNGYEAYETLRESYKQLSVDEIEDKCYSMIGRKTSSAKFTANEAGATKLPVENRKDADASKNRPYGDLFEKYTKN